MPSVLPIVVMSLPCFGGFESLMMFQTVFMKTAEGKQRSVHVRACVCVMGEIISVHF